MALHITQFIAMVFISKCETWYGLKIYNQYNVRKTLAPLRKLSQKHAIVERLLNTCGMQRFWDCWVLCSQKDNRKHHVQCNLDLVTLNLVTTCDLETILQRPFFNLLHKIIWFSDIMQFSDSFCRDQKCHQIKIALYSENPGTRFLWQHFVIRNNKK